MNLAAYNIYMYVLLYVDYIYSEESVHSKYYNIGL